MKVSDLASYLPADLEMHVIFPSKCQGDKWARSGFLGRVEQFLKCGVDGDVSSIDVTNDGNLIIVVWVCRPMEEEDKTND